MHTSFLSAKKSRAASPEPRAPYSKFATGGIRNVLLATLVLMLASGAMWAQGNAPRSGAAPRSADAAAKSVPADVSGMYTFLREGEFVEVDLEPDGRVIGFISRYGDRESDRGLFLEHMFSKGTIQGNKLTFTTRSVHGVSFEFKGTIERGEAKAAGAEGYWVIRGTLTQMTEDQNHKTTAQQREVTFKSFPADALAPAPKRD